MTQVAKDKFILDPIARLPLNQIVCGDSLEVMKTFPPESIDLIATDPPYGYSFMGKDWDKAVPSVDVWKECCRVLKDGAFIFVMSAPRQDVLSQMIIRLGQAGFDTGFTSIYWTYASGFPKAYNIAKGVEGKLVLGTANWSDWNKLKGEKLEGHIGYHKLQKEQGYRPKDYTEKERIGKVDYTTSEAKALDGSYGGYQPKPAVEVIIVCMKPLSEKTYVEQALKNGKGVTWLDPARIPFQSTDAEKSVHNWKPNSDYDVDNTSYELGIHKLDTHQNEKGRFPANLLVSDDVLNDGISRKSGVFDNEKHQYHVPKTDGKYGEYQTNCPNQVSYGDSGSFSRFFDLDKWFEKTVENLPESVRKTFPFLICPKASKTERNQGLVNDDREVFRAGHGNQEQDDVTQRFRTRMKNFHPTVKPLKLMSYLVTLGSRPKEIVLDPFVGSGTTCLASEILNRKWIGIEISPKYCEIARKRLVAIPMKITTFF